MTPNSTADAPNKIRCGKVIFIENQILLGDECLTREHGKE